MKTLPRRTLLRHARAGNPVVKLALDVGWTSTFFAAPVVFGR